MDKAAAQEKMEEEMKEMKEIKLQPDQPLHNRVEVAVIDFPDGKSREERQRCKVTVEFAQCDVKQLQERGLTFEEAMKYYKEWLYEVIKVNLAQDWVCVEGMEEVMAIIEESVKQYYQE